MGFCCFHDHFLYRGLFLEVLALASMISYLTEDICNEQKAT